jgi:hypothetical protein
MIPAAFFLLSLMNAATAQQPVSAQPPLATSVPAPAAVAGTPVQPTAGATVVQGSGGCSNCGTGSGLKGAVQSVTGGNCLYGNYACQNGCGSVKSDLAFQFGSCKTFFSPCGPMCNGALGGKCGYLQFAKPYGTGWTCPRQFDTYLNH